MTKELYNLSKNLIALRNQFGYTQTDVAKKLGIAPQSYRAYECGITVPTLENFIKLAKIFDVDYKELLE